MTDMAIPTWLLELDDRGQHITPARYLVVIGMKWFCDITQAMKNVSWYYRDIKNTKH